MAFPIFATLASQKKILQKYNDHYLRIQTRHSDIGVLLYLLSLLILPPSAVSGPTCEERVYDCSVHACQSGGSCIPQGRDNYTCSCAPGYYGEYCQHYISKYSLQIKLNFYILMEYCFNRNKVLCTLEDLWREESLCQTISLLQLKLSNYL